jgi:hypothetical protein
MAKMVLTSSSATWPAPLPLAAVDAILYTSSASQGAPEWHVRSTIRLA